MELVGEEQRIQALFSEIRLADEQTAPSFVGVWNRAQLQSQRPRRAFNLSFVTVTALLVCALITLAWWMIRSQRTVDSIATIPPVVVNGGGLKAGTLPKVTPEEVKPRAASPNSTPVLASTHRASDKSRALKLSAQRETIQLAAQLAASQKAMREANAIANWESPTATLLDSPSDELLKSVPQLNQSSDDLRSFLPNRPR